MSKFMGEMTPEIINYADLHTAQLVINEDSSDVKILQKISQLVLEKNNISDLEYSISLLLTNLEERAEFFNKKGFLLRRFEGWCSVLCNLTGLFSTANMRFLYETGYLISDEIYGRLFELYKRGLIFSNRRVGSITLPQQWEKIILKGRYKHRKQLANGLNYLARDHYIFSRDKKFEELELLDKHFDILVQIFVFSDLRVNDRKDYLYSSVLIAFEGLLYYFRTSMVQEKGFFDLFLKNDTTKNIWDKNFPRKLKSIFFIYSRLSFNLNMTGSAEEFKNWFYDPNHKYKANELILFFPLLTSLKEKELILKYDFNKLNASNDGLVTKRDIICITELLNLGFDGINIEKFNFKDYCKNMSYSDLYYLLNLYKFKPSIFTTELLLEIKQFLLMKHKKSSYNINHLARMTQYNKICELEKGLKDANNIYDLVYDRHENIINKKKSTNVVLFILSGCPVLPSLFSAVTMPLLDEGVEFYNFEKNGFENNIVKYWDKTPLLLADSSNFVGNTKVIDGLLNPAWRIDLQRGKLVLDGVNYFQGLYERMSRLFKVYEIDWNMPSVQLFYKLWLKKLDRILFGLQDVYTVAKKENFKISLVSLQSQFNPWYALKVFSEKYSDVFQHITIGSSYENWKTNMSGEFLSTLAMLNNTQNIVPSMPAFGTTDNFNEWFKTEFLPRKSEYIKQNTELVSMKRSGTNDSTDELSVLTRKIKEYKSKGKLVFCALGKIPYDMAVPYQGGPAHTDMLDWLNHTIDTIEGGGNLLLVKPHPHELNYAISAKPNQGFVDMIKSPKDQLINTLILPHRGINIQDLFYLVDVFVCWNGSSIAELGSQGKKIIACDDWAKYNYPIDVYLPKSRQHYEKILQGVADVKMHPNFVLKSIAYNSYLTTAPFAIDYPFVQRSSTNTKFHEILVKEQNFTEENISQLMYKKESIKEIFKI